MALLYQERKLFLLQYELLIHVGSYSLQIPEFFTEIDV